MNVLYEAQLRDMLAERLILIEPGLRLVDTEYSMPNAHGTRGRIDILARDRHGSWVVIELKRSDSSSARALHEVTKYAELLQREMGLRANRIRAMIVSTTWRELRVPVSNMARDWSHDLRGYQLTLDDEGRPVRADRVEFLEAPVPPRVTPHHFMYFYNSPQERDAGWHEIKTRAAEVGAQDVLAANFRRMAQRDLVVAPYGLYCAIGRVHLDDMPAWLDHYGSESYEDHGGFPLEYTVRGHILSHVFAADCELAHPGMLRKLDEDPRWEIEDYRLAGDFARRTPLDEQDLLRDLNGDEEGLGEILYTGSARTTDRGRWPAFREESRRCFAGNPAWAQLVGRWLEDVSADSVERDVLLHVYNPCDLIQSLVHGWPDDLDRLVPMVWGTALTEFGTERTIRGSLYWDGTPQSRMADLASLVYRDSIHWITHRTMGESWIADLDLLSLFGLHYVLIEQIGGNPLDASTADELRFHFVQDDRLCTLPIPCEGSLLRNAGWHGAYTLSTFLEQHCDQIDAMVANYRSGLHFAP
ncbi:endonuclease NucS [Streptomyces malaysiensis subsp. malaysiensis]|uniref:endonuclease NucS domain-containing protein n=1 Tax=Streptomyces malaysiensis TaxID=92644 RepID=UPI0024BFF3DD|nr:endonuclease NucS domain-containing protein [Streptomyces sp. NA07423]WHX17702.1 endonuclease NucS [Streptomyces sp. NA07423]